MRETLFHTALEQYGLVIYSDDNEIGLVLDDGTIEYVDKTEVQRKDDNRSTVRKTLWRVARITYSDLAEAAEHYSQTLAFWSKKAADAGKTCSQCGGFKHFSEFVKDVNSNDGYRRVCKECYARTNAERYKARKSQD